MARSSSSSDLSGNATGTAVAKSPKKPSAKSKGDAESKKAKPRRREREQVQAEEEEELLEDDSPGLMQRIFGNSTSWAASLIVHMIIIIALALMYLPSPEIFDSIISSVVTEEVNDEVIDVPEIDFTEDIPDEIPEEITEQPETDVIEDMVDFSPFDEELAASAPVELSPVGLSEAPINPTNTVGTTGNALEGRGHKSRAAMARKGGGTQQSEEAVEMALAWLAKHQNRDGTWHLDHSNGGDCNGQCPNPGTIKDSYRAGTALALLPYLGAGYTRFEGKYKATVGRGLDALVRLGKKPPKGAGATWEDGGNMYAHGIAAIALCEAYGMTGESQLAMPAQAAIDYIVSAQNPNDGGWRYKYQSPGDTSVVGWQIMALKSAHLGKLNVPATTVKGASKYLDLAQTDEYGSGYGYTPGGKGFRAPMAAVGLICRMYLGWKRDHQGIVEGATKISNVGPSKSDFYYNYYAAQLMFQFTNGQGAMWRKWNEKLREQLIQSQAKEGHAKGSWHTRGAHGNDKGGRLYCTAMGCMTLEVYYRHMPIYKTENVEMEFPE